MMTPTGTAICNDSYASLPTSHAWTTVYQPKLSSTTIDHSQAEVAKTFHYGEFGNGSANGNASYADASMLNTDANIAYVMDDGLTSLSGTDISRDLSGVTSALWLDDASGSMYITFIGTGVHLKSDYVSYTHNQTIAQNLPYGTHILKIIRPHDNSDSDYTLDGVTFNVANGGYGNWNEVTFHQPKKPPIPEDAVVLADYMLMADFVHQTTAGTQSVSYTHLTLPTTHYV